MIAHAWTTLWGLVLLAGMGLRTGFRLKGPYWTWRQHTAFGPWGPSSRAEGRRALLEYARWLAQYRRFR